MKKLNFYLKSLIVLSTIAIISCSKEDVKPLENNIRTQNESKIKVNQGVLVIENDEEMIKTLNFLEVGYKKNLENISDLMKDKSIEEQIQIREEKNLDESKTFVEFEKNFNYVSLRKKIENEMATYELRVDENGKSIDNPDDININDKYLRVLLNSDGEIIVGEKMYKFFNNGDFVEINHTDIRLLKDINENNYMSFSENDDNIILYDLGPKDDRAVCLGNVNSGNISISNSNYKLELKTSVINTPWAHKIVAETRTFIKSGSSWVPYWVNTTARINGPSTRNQNIGCGFLYTANTELDVDLYEAEATEDATDSPYNKTWFKVQPGFVQSYHTATGTGLTFNVVLNW